MKKDLNYLAINRKLWDDKVAVHLASEFYDMPAFLNGANTLNEPELRLLGDVSGKSILHLQCHFGQDTCSLSRMGAAVTGVDFSEAAIKAAKNITQQLNLSTQFIVTDIYELPAKLDEVFDLVFTSYGTVGWLPDLQRWAQVVSRFLKPGGQFVMVDFHPVVWMFDNDFKTLTYPYLKKDAIVEVESGTYAEKDAPINGKSISWNHGLSEIIGSLLDAGLELTVMQELDYSPYPCFNNMVAVANGKYQIAGLEGIIPMLYALKFEKSIS